MPMHYPPLANGTYRYGDAPRPLPSPTPGPDPQQPSDALPFATPSPAATPPAAPPPAAPNQQPPTGTPRATNPRASALVIGGLAVAVVVLLGGFFLLPDTDRAEGFDALRDTLPLGEPAPGLAPAPGAGSPGSPGATGVFTADGTFTVVSTPGEPVSGDGAGCDMPVTLSDIGEGTVLTLLEADTGRSVESLLAYDGGDLTSCTFTFSFPDVTPGGSLYLVELPGRGQLVYSEGELRTGIDISLGR